MLWHKLIGAGGVSVGSTIGFLSSTIVADKRDFINVARPVGASAGDLMIVAGIISKFEIVTSVDNSGWTSRLNEAGDPTAILFSKVLTSSEPSFYKFNISKPGFGYADIIMSSFLYRGATGFNVIGFTTRADSDTSTGASIPPTEKGVLIGSFGFSREASIISSPNGMSEINARAQRDLTLACYDLNPSSTGSTGNKSVVWGDVDKNFGLLMQIY